MSTVARRPFITDVSVEKSIKILADPNVSYCLMYWDIFSVGATSRELLAYGKVKWSNERVVEVIVAESMVIEQYLAKKFDLFGDNEWEDITIRGLYSNIHFFLERALTRTTWVTPDKRKRALGIFLEHFLPEFISDHEMHLRANGSNGHYVGNRLSLADIHLANVIEHFSHLPVANVIMPEFEKSELITKVRENVKKNPEIAAWRANPEYESLRQGSFVCYAKTAIKEDDEVTKEA
ncbi:hypothetical protein BGX33_001187 [Mortierella sp. NVP41]|nr:hypothetical protein BGX33_001187 [Mortierella sp. NVP41]